MHILLIDDHTLFRQGLRFLISGLDDSLSLTELGSCEEIKLMEENQSVDLVLLDYYLPGLNGIAALHTVRARFDSAPIVVLSSEDNPHVIRKAIEQGAAGFVPKSSTPEVLVAAIKLILAGGIYLPPNAIGDTEHFAYFAYQQEAHHEDLDESAVPKHYEGLSDRQSEVLIKAIQGKPNKVIAREMHISEGTVKAHLSASFRALGVKNRTEAVFVAAKNGFTP